MLRSAVIAVCLGGCSIAIVGPDTTRTVRTAPHCETSKTLVKLDGAMATGLAIVGGALTGSNAGSAGGILLVSGALYAAAALRGNNVVDHCRAAFDEYEKEIAAGPPIDRGPPIRPVALRPAAVAAAPPPRPAPAPATSAPAALPRATPPATRHPTPSPTDDGFHKVVGEQPAPKRAPTQISEPTTAPWRDFWREVP